MKLQDAVDDLWRKKPEQIRRFLDCTPRYEKLAEEVAYIVENKIRTAGIGYASVAYRVKTLNSFCEKVARKGYEDPLVEATDLAGVRIVYLYSTDRLSLEQLIEEEFNIVEKVDKVEAGDADRFGYGALHYLLKLGKGANGARYDELKDLVCEVQVRTILQDAWALVAHQLMYKKESDIPNVLRRKLNALAGLFETADDQFDQINSARKGYAAGVEKILHEGPSDLLSQNINLDSLIEFLRWRLAERKHTSREDAADLLATLQSLGYKTLGDIDDVLYRTEDAVKALEHQHPPTDEETGGKVLYAPVGVVRVAIEFVNEEYRRKANIDSPVFLEQYNEFLHLVKPPKTRGQLG